MTIKEGSTGDFVKAWQEFLGVEPADEIFGDQTDLATRAFQAKCGLRDDGIVGDKTLQCARDLGFSEMQIVTNYPGKPDFRPLVSTTAREKVFGKFKYRRIGNGNIQITDDWATKNIVKVALPQLIGIEGAPKNGIIEFHRLGAEQLRALFAEWEKLGLLKYIKTWAGSYVPRFQRGSANALSNHAFGSAFDINAAWNPLGKVPALPGAIGSVCELVPTAHKFGIYWGGHFSRPDGMHFELAKIL